MPQYHEVNMYSQVALASQLPTMLIIMYSPARPTQYLYVCIRIYYDVSL